MAILSLIKSNFSYFFRKTHLNFKIQRLQAEYFRKCFSIFINTGNFHLAYNITINYNNQIMNLNWIRQQEEKPYEGQQKQGYTLTYIPDLHSLLLFGGSFNRSAQIYLYDIINRKWNLQKTSGKPQSRKNHTAYYEQSIKMLIIYGGEAERKRSLDTFDILMISEWRWSKLLLKTSPTPRQFHTFTPIGNGNFLIFGGITMPYFHFLKDLWMLKGLDKIKNTGTTQNPGCMCSQLSFKGTPPPGRYDHRAYYYQDHYYIIGGLVQIPEENFTIYILDMRRMLWSRQNFNINLSQISGFSIITNPLSLNQIYIFGGIIKSQNKRNSHLYSMQFLSTAPPTIKKLQKLPNLDPSVFTNSCELPFNQVCGMCCAFVNGVMMSYKVQIRSQNETLGLEQYLKYIKNQQLLSQELLRKTQNLEALYKEIQIYTSLLFKQYQQSGQYDEQIEQQKKIQIESCLQLKAQYSQIDHIYSENLNDLKKARRELALINQHFQGYIQTQRDQDQ